MDSFYAPHGKFLWDSWFIKRDQQYHLFHLQVSPSRAVDVRPDEDISIGHAVSDDLITWHELPTALKPGDTGAWDSLSLWTGSIIEKDGTYYMFYTGRSTNPGEAWIQRIGVATSKDLVLWEKYTENPILEADSRYYDMSNEVNALKNISAWRDPYMFYDPVHKKYYMLISARKRGEATEYNGCIGIAESENLLDWKVLPPLFAPGLYDEMEVPQLIIENGSYYLFFSTHASGYEPSHAKKFGSHGGRHCYRSDSLFGTYKPVNGNGVVHSHEDAIYDVTIVHDAPQKYTAFGWLNKDEYGRFVGKLSHPLTVSISEDTVTVTDSVQN